MRFSFWQPGSVRYSQDTIIAYTVFSGRRIEITHLQSRLSAVDVKMKTSSFDYFSQCIKREVYLHYGRCSAAYFEYVFIKHNTDLLTASNLKASVIIAVVTSQKHIFYCFFCIVKIRICIIIDNISNR